jgi:hypothetical protein
MWRATNARPDQHLAGQPARHRLAIADAFTVPAAPVVMGDHVNHGATTAAPSAMTGMVNCLNLALLALASPPRLTGLSLLRERSARSPCGACRSQVT